jgi:hypothetical protein
MSLSESKCWYSNNCLHFLKCAVPLFKDGGRKLGRYFERRPSCPGCGFSFEAHFRYKLETHFRFSLTTRYHSWALVKFDKFVAVAKIFLIKKLLNIRTLKVWRGKKYRWLLAGRPGSRLGCCGSFRGQARWMQVNSPRVFSSKRQAESENFKRRYLSFQTC